MNSAMMYIIGEKTPDKSLVVGTGGVSLEDFLGCDIEKFLNI